MTLGFRRLPSCASLACFLAIACNAAVDKDADASTSMQGTSSGESSESSGDPTTDQGSGGATTAKGDSSGGAQGCDPLPQEDAPCSEDGQTCSSGCTDACQFCNVLLCENGVWGRLEAPPAPCLECEALCDLVVPIACTGGPPDTQTCLTGCEQAIAGECAAEFSNTRACAGLEPAFSCNDDDRPHVAGCETQYAALYVCMGI